MGRNAQLKAQRLQARLRTAQQRQTVVDAKKPCTDCAFSDPEAWVADAAMGHKLVQCLTEPNAHPFYCHEGMPLEMRLDGSPGAYLPPTRADGSVDTTSMVPCGGFLRFAAQVRERSLMRKRQAVWALQRKMCARFLAGDDPNAAELRQACGGRADVLQDALNMQSLGVLWDEAPKVPTTEKGLSHANG